MKKVIVFFVTVCLILLCGCNQMPGESTETAPTKSVVQEEKQTTTVSGSFTGTIRDVIPDYCLDDVTPSVAIVTQFQSTPFTLQVGAQIGSQLEIGKTYTFTIKPMVVDSPKESVQALPLAAMVSLSGFEIAEFRLADESEFGLAGAQLTIE